MTATLIILGTGGSSLDVLDIVEAINDVRPQWEVLGFLDDGRAPGSEHHGYPVLGPLSAVHNYPQCRFINTIGSDRNYHRRKEIITGTELKLEQFATLIHPQASVSSRAKVGLGTYVNYGVSVGGGVVIGNHVSLCPGVIVGHDAVLEDYALLAPGCIVSGFVRLGQSCYVGAGAMIRQRGQVGAGALVGMGAVVLHDVPTATTVVGNPAHPLHRAKTQEQLPSSKEMTCIPTW